MKNSEKQVNSISQPSNNYWSATLNNSTNAYNVNLNDGNSNNNTIYNNTNYVRCVRKRRPARFYPYKIKQCKHILHSKTYIRRILIVARENQRHFMPRNLLRIWKKICLRLKNNCKLELTSRVARLLSLSRNRKSGRFLPPTFAIGSFIIFCTTICRRFLKKYSFTIPGLAEKARARTEQCFACESSRVNLRERESKNAEKLLLKNGYQKLFYQYRPANIV